MFCGKCGNENSVKNKFCVSCGKPLEHKQSSVQNISPILGKSEQLDDELESKNYFSGTGEIIIKTIQPVSTGRKTVNVFKKTTHKLEINDKPIEKYSKGELTITKNSIRCGKNEYPFIKIESVAQTGTISKFIFAIFLISDKGKKYRLKAEIKSNDNSSIFRALEIIRSERVEIWTKSNPLKNVNNYFKDRIGIDFDHT